ncbi:MAG: MFS transporter [Candidatus Heimdallarchaeota archaeon]|nr:MFS transporter [Candidatus Heimdallarchaeota archaeon]
MNDSVTESTILVDEDILSLPVITHKQKIVLLLISTFGTAARMIGRMFVEMYAVVIGSSKTAISLITSIRNLITLAFQSSFGRISDFLGRKLLILIGLFGGGISLALFPFIRNQWVLVVGVFFFSLCFAIYNPSFTALIGDLTKKENRAGLFSLLTLVGSLASFIGLLSVGELSNLVQPHLTTYNYLDFTSMGSILLSVTKFSSGLESNFLSLFQHNQYSMVLYLAACLFVVTGIISFLLTDPPTEKLTERTVLSFTPVRENKRFRRFVIVGSIMGFVMSLGWPIFPFVRVNYATAQENTWIWATFSVVMMLTLLITRPFIDKMKRKWALYIGRCLMFIIPINLALTAMYLPTWWFMAIGAGISGFGNSFYFVAESSYALDCAPEKEKGTYTGLFYFFLGFSTFFGSLISGLLADLVENYIGEYMTIIIFLWIIAGARFLAAFGFLFLKEPMNKKNG